MPGQAYQVAVPHSASVFTMGTANGGDGVSLVTVGQVLIDAVGTLSLQAKGAMTAQTTNAMAWLSTGGSSMHSVAGIKIYAGGGSAPGPCGQGGPAKPAKNDPPAKTAENVVAAATSVSSLAKTGFDMRDALKDLGGSDAAKAAAARWSLGKAGADILKQIPAQGTGHLKPEKGSAGDAAVGYGGAAMDVVSGVAGIVSGAIKKDAGSVASGASSAASGIIAAIAKAVGAVDIEERAAGNIKMVATRKIEGKCGDSFDFKTANQFTVNAGMVVDFATTTFANFAIAKWGAKAGWAVKIGCNKAEIKGRSKGEFKAIKVPFSGKTFTGKAPDVVVDKLLVIKKGNTKINKKLNVKKDMKVTKENLIQDDAGQKVALNANLTVDGNVLIEKDVTVKDMSNWKAPVTFESGVSYKGKIEIKGQCVLGM